MDHIKNILTFDEVVDIAKKITNDNSVQVLDCSLNDLSQEKLGFTGTHHILTITVQKSDAKSHETISAFVKIASLKLDGFDKDIDLNSFMADRESFFLNTLVSQFTEVYKSEKWCPIHYYTKKNIAYFFQRFHANSSETVHTFFKSIPVYNDATSDSEMYTPILMQESFFFEKILPELTCNYKSEKWCPAHYLTTKKAIIIENLKFSGYRMIQDSNDNPVVLKSILASLARFHSCSILAEARLSRQAKHPVMLNEHFNDSISELMFSFDPEGDKGHWYNCGVNLACNLAERLGYDPEQIRTVFNRVYDMVKPSKVYQNAICHGDLHIYNIMFADSSSVYKSILVDFQLIRYAPMVTDVLGVLYLNASRKFREENEAELIEYYHSVLVETIKIHDPTIELPTLQSIVNDLEDFRAFGLIIACIYLPLALLHSKDVDQLLRDSKSVFNFMFGDRLELVAALMEVDEAYRNVVESAIIELAENGVR